SFNSMHAYFFFLILVVDIATNHEQGRNSRFPYQIHLAFHFQDVQSKGSPSGEFYIFYRFRLDQYQFYGWNSGNQDCPVDGARIQEPYQDTKNYGGKGVDIQESRPRRSKICKNFPYRRGIEVENPVCKDNQ